jgi:tryptophan synthase beta chain
VLIKNKTIPLTNTLLKKTLVKKRIIAETGAGQHGVPPPFAFCAYGYQCVVYMGEVDIERQSQTVRAYVALGGSACTRKPLKDATNEAEIRGLINNPVFPRDTLIILLCDRCVPHPYPDIWLLCFQSVMK